MSPSNTANFQRRKLRFCPLFIPTVLTLVELFITSYWDGSQKPLAWSPQWQSHFPIWTTLLPGSFFISSSPHHQKGGMLVPVQSYTLSSSLVNCPYTPYKLILVFLNTVSLLMLFPLLYSYGSFKAHPKWYHCSKYYTPPVLLPDRTSLSLCFCFFKTLTMYLHYSPYQ